MTRRRPSSAIAGDEPAGEAVADTLRPALDPRAVTRSALVLAVGNLVIVGTWLLATRFSTAPDTASYVAVERMIRHLDFASYDAARTPGYPLLILLTGSNRAVLAALQLVFGGLVSVLVWWTVLRQTGSAWWGTAAGLVVAASPALLVADRSMLTESLALVLVAAAVALAFGACAPGAPPASRGAPRALLAGAVLAAAVLTRPSLVILAVLVAISWWLATRRGTNRTSRTSRLAPVFVLLPVVVAYGGLVLANRHLAGFTGPSSLQGYALANATCDYAGDIPDAYADIRGPYLDAIHRAGGAGCVDAIWPASTVIVAQNHETSAALSQRLTRMSVDLIRQHPVGYVRHSALEASHEWVARQLVPDGQRTRLGRTAGFRLLATLQIAAEVAVHLAYLFIVLCWIAARLLRRPSRHGAAFVVLASYPLVNSLANGLIDAGSRTRLFLPGLPVVVIVLAVALAGVMGGRTRVTAAPEVAVAASGGPA